MACWDPSGTQGLAQQPGDTGWFLCLLWLGKVVVPYSLSSGSKRHHGEPVGRTVQNVCLAASAGGAAALRIVVLTLPGARLVQAPSVRAHALNETAPEGRWGA